MTRPALCPICKKPVADDPAAAKTLPFCSERCRQMDLFRWVDGKYAIVEPLQPNQLEEGSEESLPPGWDDEESED